MLSEQDVQAISDYAQIALNETEMQEMQTYLNEAVALLDQIKKYDLDDVEPTYHPIGSLCNVMGDDDSIEARGFTIDEALNNAAQSHERSFKVPSILGDGGDR